nr:MAG TPA: hypothetical protein [Caudoviricetes sp.]
MNTYQKDSMNTNLYQNYKDYSKHQLTSIQLH